MMHLKFKDLATYDPSAKTAISVRDGVLEYLGAEIGMTPADKVFTIYRSPATIANAAMKMQGIAVTNEHIDLSSPAPKDGGTVTQSEMIDIVENGVATIAIKNKVKLSDELKETAQEKRELSLGYFADLVEHEVYDFEQKDIVPHHLAIVPAGRCGDMCSFIDRKPNVSEQDMKFKFIDEDGKIDLQTIVEVMTKLPEAIRKVPVEEVAKIMPMLQELIAASEGVMPEEDGDNESPAEEAVEEVVEEEAAEEQLDEEADKEEITDEEAGEDSDEDKQGMKDAAIDFKDTQEFADAVKAAVDAETGKIVSVIEKARDFVDAGYVFADKDANQIMRDAIATKSKESFADAELPVAFKMLKKSVDKYITFGDKKVDTGLDSLYDKEL